MGKLHQMVLQKAAEGYKMSFEAINNTLMTHSDIIKDTVVNSKTFKEFLRLAATNGMAAGGENDGLNKIVYEFTGEHVDEERIIDALRDCWMDNGENNRKLLFDRCSVIRKAIEKAEKEKNKELADENEKELLERWRVATWHGIGGHVDSMLKTLESMYRSGIENLPAVGILINNGPDLSPLISAKTVKNGAELSSNIINEIDSGSRFDLKIMGVMAKYLGSLNYMDGIDPRTGFPTLEALMSNKGTMRNAHLMFQTASIPFSARDNNKNSIRKWITATKDMAYEDWIREHNNGKHTSLCKWSDVSAWYRWVIENTLFRYFTEAGLDPDKSGLSGLDKVEQITLMFSKKLKNVVSVSERVNRKSRMETTELKFTTDDEINVDAMAEEIAAALNLGNAKDITCKGRVLSNQVYCLTVVYDQKAANKATKFAAEIIDTVIASGNVPSWNNVLIGKKQSGDLLFWDFTNTPDAASCSYAIYAGSGAGKGNMTLTLMAAALADGKQLFYTDGKPDSGGAIASLAWKDGCEAYMFDGQPKGTGSSFPGILEEHPVVNGMRSLKEVTQTSSSIPNGIFTEYETMMFLGVCRYLRSLQLCVEILNARGASTLPKQEWQIWVFDEMTAMSENEREVRKVMGAYLAKKGFGNCFTITKASKDNPKNSNVLIAAKEGEKLEEAKQKDAGVAYIYDWLTWTSSIVAQVPNLVKIGLRQANANIFLIFQKADWLSEHAGVTTLSMFATALDCRKIVGANGLATQCGQYGNGYTMNSGWYRDYVSKGNGWWAMSHSSDLGKAYSDSDVDIIKPFSIWGYRKVGDTTSPAENFFDYYVAKLSTICEQPVSKTLQSAYDYATEAVKILAENGRITTADNVKQFIYDVSRFSVENAEFDTSTLYEKLKESGIENTNSPMSDYNNPVTFSEDANKNIEKLDNSHSRLNPLMSADEELRMIKEMEHESIAPDIPDEEEYEDSEFSFEDDPDLYGDDEKYTGEIETPEIMSDYDSDDSSEFSVDIEESSLAPESVGSVDRAYESGDLAPTVKKGKDPHWGTDARGGNVVDTSRVGHGTVTKTLDRGKEKGNFIVVETNPFTSKQLEKAFNNEKAYNKLMGTAFSVLLSDIAKYAGGRMSVKSLTVMCDRIFVNAKLVKHGMFADERMDILDMLDFGEMLNYFSNLNILTLDTETMRVLEEQITYCITEEDAANGINDALDYILRHRAKLNTIRVKAVGEDKMLEERRKADLLNKRRKEHLAGVKERANNQAKKELDTCFREAKKQRGIKLQPQRKINTKTTSKKIKSNKRGFLSTVGGMFGGILNLSRGSFMK